MKDQTMTWKAFFRAVLVIALPIAMQNLLATTAGMIDTIMIGTLGELPVAAVGICSQIGSLFFSCYFGFASGGMLFFGQYWGASDEKGINRTFGITLCCMLAIGVLFGSMAIFAPEVLMKIYTDKESIQEIGISYLRIVGFAYPLQVIAGIINYLMRSTERVRIPLFAAIVATLTNFVLNWILIFGRFGMPQMGAAGAAVGTVAAGVVNVFILSIALLRDRSSVRLRWKTMFHWGNGFYKKYLGICFPILCNELLYGIGQMLINVVIGRQSESAIAAMAAFRVIEGIIFAFFGGLADASCVIVGKEIGAGRHMNGYKNTIRFSILCPMVTFVICAVALIFSTPLLGLFGLGSQAMLYGKYMLAIYLAAGTVRTCNYIMNICFRAGGETVFGTVLEVGCLYAISVPATWISGMLLHLPFLAVFSFLYTDELIRLFFEIRYTRSAKWIKPVTNSGKESLQEFLNDKKLQKY